MQLIKVFTILLFLPLAAFSQIPNPSFENWTNSYPDEWLINISPPLLMPVTSTNDANTGNFAIKGEIIDDMGLPFGPYIQPSTTSFGFPVTSNDTVLYGYFKSEMVGSNLGLIEVAVYDSSHDLIGMGFSYLPTCTNFTGFSVPVIYNPGAVAHEMTVIMQMTDTDSVAGFNIGSYFIIDDLSFTYVPPVGIGQIPAKTFIVSPNPAGDLVMISGELNIRRKHFVSLFDISGKKIFQSNLIPGTDGSIQIDVSEFLVGVYILAITDGEKTFSHKLVINR